MKPLPTLRQCPGKNEDEGAPTDRGVLGSLAVVVPNIGRMKERWLDRVEGMVACQGIRVPTSVAGLFRILMEAG